MHNGSDLCSVVRCAEFGYVQHTFTTTKRTLKKLASGISVLKAGFSLFRYLADLSDCIRSPTQLEDSELKLLATSLPLILENGRASSTVRKYMAGWLGWINWSNTKKEVQPRSADPFHVALYLNHFYFLHSYKGRIAAAFYGIRWGHCNTLVQLAYEGCTRLCGGGRNERTLYRWQHSSISLTISIGKIAIS